ncbi:MAG: cytidine deaminase [Pseudomonadota bacterium]
MGSGSEIDRDSLIAKAKQAASKSYSPYSNYAVGAALLFENGDVVTGTNIENASYGLSLCAETIAVSKAMADGVRGGLIAVAVTGPPDSGDGEPITPCGRCRQVLNELAQLGRTDPDIFCAGSSEVRQVKLSQLLPHAFGPGHLA